MTFYTRQHIDGIGLWWLQRCQSLRSGEYRQEAPAVLAGALDLPPIGIVAALHSFAALDQRIVSTIYQRTATMISDMLGLTKAK